MYIFFITSSKIDKSKENKVLALYNITYFVHMMAVEGIYYSTPTSFLELIQTFKAGAADHVLTCWPVLAG